MADASIEEIYARDGFYFPYSVISETEARELRDDLETAEQELRDDPQKLALLHAYPARVLPSFDALLKHPRLIDGVSQILGPDLLVWSSGLFIKEANTPSYVSWHQDLTYWGLDDAQEVTAWVALSPATVASGCMRFIPGSHTADIVGHKDTFEADNLLSRGQELTVEVDDRDGVDIVLQPGECSLHHGHLFHSSGPNQTPERRIGVALRYISPSMKQKGGEKTLASHASGEDMFKHFNSPPGPTDRLLDADFEICAADAALTRTILFAGAGDQRGKRYEHF